MFSFGNVKVQSKIDFSLECQEKIFKGKSLMDESIEL